MPLELPAVTVPSFLKAGRSFAKSSGVIAICLLGDASPEERGSPLAGALRRAFDGVLSRTTRVPSPAFLTAVGAVGVALPLTFAVFPPAGHSLLPEFRERDILVELDGAPGTSEQALRRIVSRATRDLRSIPGVRNLSAHLGRAVMSDTVADFESAEISVSIDPAADYDGTLAAIREAALAYPGFDIDVDTYVTERIRDEAEIDDALVVRIYGERLDTIRSKAEEARELLSRIDGVFDPQVEYPVEQPTLQIEVDLAKAKEYGLKPGDVRRAVTTLVSGIQVGSLFEEQKVFDVVVWGTPETRRSLSDLEELLIDTPPPWSPAKRGRLPAVGGHVRLKDVADLRIASAPTVINREAVARHIDVTADVQGRDFSAVSAEVEERIRGEIDFPLEYRAELLGEFAGQLATRNRARTFAVAAAIGILLLLQVAIGSWRLSFFFFLSLSLALTGGLLTALAAGSLVSLGSILGLLGVLGIALRNGLTLIQHYRHLERREGEALSVALVRRGTADRSAPMVMTAFVTALAVLPFALFGNIAGHEILHPMAIAVLGGLVTTTLVSLFVVPPLYLRFGAAAEPLDLLGEEEPPRQVA